MRLIDGGYSLNIKNIERIYRKMDTRPDLGPGQSTLAAILSRRLADDADG